MMRAFEPWCRRSQSHPDRYRQTVPQRTAGDLHTRCRLAIPDIGSRESSDP